MNTDLLLQLIGYFLTPIAGIVSWFAGRRTRENGTLNELQHTIDELCKKNCELIAEITLLRSENSSLKNEIQNANREITKVRLENKELKDGQDELHKQLELLKSISKGRTTVSARTTRKASAEKKTTK